MLKSANDGQKFPSRGAVLALGRIHYAGKEGDGALNSLDNLTQYSTNRNIAGVRVYDARKVGVGEGERRGIYQCSLQSVKSLLDL